MPLSNAEKQRRYRERKRTERETRERYDRGLPEPEPEAEVLEGARMTVSGILTAKYDHYEALDDTFPPVPDDILALTMTTADGEVKPLPEFECKRRARDERTSADISVLFEK
jgi:hypothetical protein